MDTAQILQEIKKRKLIAIVRGVKSGQIVETAGALGAGGIPCLEIAIDQTSGETVQETFRSIKLVKETFGDRIFLGAGTVLTEEQVNAAAEAGAEYMISPNTDEKVIRRTKAIGKISIPGAFTPSEAVAAYRAGADIVKLFPAGLLGPDYIKAIRGPLGHIPFTAVGGVDLTNAALFLRAGACGVSVGGNLVSLKHIAAGDFAYLTKTAQDFVKAIQDVC